jgi:hypothetical protein
LIVAVLSAHNVLFLRLPLSAGADLLVIERPMFFVEVKNPERPLSARDLTEDEKKLQRHCLEEGIGYYVVETPEQMLGILDGPQTLEEAVRTQYGN